MIKIKRRKLHPAEQYVSDILNGRIVSCNLVKKACLRYLQDKKNTKKKGLYFCKKSAQKAIDFFHIFLKHSKGKWAGEPFILEPWQQFIVWNIFGWKIGNKNGPRRFRIIYLEISRKNGKAEYIGNFIPTTKGMKKMKDIKIGDYVFNKDGYPVKVIKTTDVMYNKKCCEIKFSTGEKIKVAKDHLWKVNKRVENINLRKRWNINEDNIIKKEYPKGGVNKLKELLPYRSINSLFARAKFLNVKKYRNSHNKSVYKLNNPKILTQNIPNEVLTTKEIQKTLTYGKRNDYRYTIDVCDSADMDYIDLPLEPYTLGAWLGDGNNSDPRITISYDNIEIKNRIKEDGYCVDERKSSNLNSGLYFISKNRKFNSIKSKLRELNLIKNKHIPKIYLRSNHDQRLNLLQGLMDTDGGISKSGNQCLFYNTNKKLALNVKELICSLGFKASFRKGKAKLNGKIISNSYTVSFCPPNGIDVFCLERKRIRLKYRDVGTRSDTRTIVSVKDIKSVPVKCIQVDSDDGIYLTSRSYIPTHNSTFLAGIGLYCFICDKEAGAECYAAATKEKQAKIVHGEAIRMVKKSSNLKKKVQIFRNNLSIDETDSKFEPLGRDSDTQDGLNVHCSIIDELHAHKTRDMWDVLETATGSREQPLQIAITTAGFERTSICYEQHEYLEKILKDVGSENPYDDDTYFGMIYTIDENDDWSDEKVWIKANPNLNVSIYIDDLQRKAKKAKEIVSAVNNFLRKHLDVWVNQFSRFVDMNLWNENFANNIDERKYYGKQCYGGLDLSSVSDITAFVLLFPDINDDERLDIIARFWCPESRLTSKDNRYRNFYEAWEREGWLKTTPGDAIDYEYVKKQIIKDAGKFNLANMGVDRLFQGYQLSMELSSELGTRLIKGQKQDRVVAVGMGYKTMAPAMREFESRLLKRKLNHGNHPILRWMADNLAVSEDAAGNKKPDKANSQGKIDGIVSLLIAIDRLQREESYSGSIYEKKGLKVV